MKKHNGVWLPDYDTHFPEMMDKDESKCLSGKMVGVYQYKKMKKSLAKVRSFRTAIDVGAHVGFWSMWMADCFQSLHAFEPVQSHAACWRRNVTAENAQLHECALGASAGFAGVSAETENSGKTHINGMGEIRVLTLDEIGITDVDFIKIDVEGFESAVIEGAKSTILKFRPVIVVESNGQHERYGFQDPVDLLTDMGASVIERMRHDVIMGWEC
jgi:FkbM family methyltransferase